MNVLRNSVTCMCLHLKERKEVRKSYQKGIQVTVFVYKYVLGVYVYVFCEEKEEAKPGNWSSLYQRK